MSERLTAEPGTLEFLRQLEAIAVESDHPMDRALARVLSKHIKEEESVREGTPDVAAGATEGDEGCIA
jgi:hypothetical protein